MWKWLSEHKLQADTVDILQGSYGHEKPGKVMEF